MINAKWFSVFIFMVIQCHAINGLGNCSNDIVEEINIRYEEIWLFDFPGAYNNDNISTIPCQWRIVAPDDYVIEMSIDGIIISDSNFNCSKASLNIFDGYDAASTSLRKVCQNVTQKLTLSYTDTKYMFIQLYRSTTHPTDIEFYLSFEAEEKTDSPFGYSRRTSVGVAIGIIAGIILIIAMGTTIAFCCMARQDEKKRKRRMAYKAEQETPAADSAV